VASYLFGRKPQGLIAVAIATSVGYLGYLCLLVPLDPLWTLLVFIGIAVLIFLWGRVGSVAKLQWEHAIFFPLTSAVVSWAHFVMGKPILESLLAGIPIGLLFTVGVVRYIQQSPVITLIVTLAMALLIEQLVIVFFRYDAQLLPPFVEATLNVHTDPGALYVAIGQAIILSLVLGLWAYRLLSAYLGRGRALRWIGAILLFFVLEHSLMMGLEGRFEPATSADLGIFFVGLGVTLSLALALALHRYLARNAILYSWLISLVMGLGILIEQIAFVYYAWDIQSVFYLFGINRVQDLKLDMNRLVLFAVAALIIGLFWYFVQRTRTGKAILATSMDQEGAAHVGIDVRRVYTLTWALSGAMAGIAGVFLAAWLPMLPFMWRDPLIISFAIVVLGGLGSLKGSLLAAGIIGFAETLTAYTNPLRVYLNQPSNPFEQPYYFDFLGLSWVGVPSLFILVLILFLRPKGLFGREFE
jgi:branched-subunit amino acid ABC-type transport system permease component